MNSSLEGAQDVGMGIVAHGAGFDPADMDIGEVDRRVNSPFSVGPQCAKVSPSKNPGAASTPSVALLILTGDRSNGDGVVVDFPLN
jgi:hypothetical protein